MKKQIKRLRTILFTTAFILLLSLLPGNVVHARALIDKTVISSSASGDPSDSTARPTFVVMTPDNRYVGFDSNATNLVADTSSSYTEAYIKDTQANTYEVVSRADNNDLANATSATVAISNDGRYVLFTSKATNLGNAGPDQSDTAYAQLYLRDRQAGTTELINLPANNNVFATFNSMSSDASVIGYAGATGGFIYNRNTGTTTNIGGSRDLHISSDGTNATYITQGANSTQNLVKYDIASGQTTTLVADSKFRTYRISPDHSHFAYTLSNPGDTNGTDMDFYVIDFTTNTTIDLVSHIQGYVNHWMTFSADNVYVTYFVNTPQNSLPSRGQFWAINTTTKDKVLVEPDLLKYAPAQFNSDGSKLTYALDGNGTWQIYQATLGSQLPAPTGLSAVSPTNNPQLSWNALIGADHYLIYRDGVQVDSSATASYNDSTAPQGVHTYTVAAVDGSQVTSVQSASIAVTVDKTAPAISGATINPTALVFTHNATVSATTSDTLSGVARGEYYIDTDPGVGNGISISYANGKISGSAVISGLNNGSHRLYLRSLDKAGNWSTAVSVQFTYINFN